MLGTTVQDSTFASSIFDAFATTPLQDAAAGGGGGGVVLTNAGAVDQLGNLIGDPAQFVQVLNPLTGQIENQAIPPGYSKPSSLSDWFSTIGKDLGSVGNVTLLALGLVAAIIIIPRLLPRQ